MPKPAYLDDLWLDDLAGGYRAAQVLFTACRLSLFDRLGEQRLTLGEVVGLLGTDRRATRILLDALTGLGLLEQSDARYSNSRIARHCLCADSPHSKVAQMLHGARLYERWGGLYDAVIGGGPVPAERVDRRLPEGRTAFAHAMADSARSAARTTVEALDLSRVRSILDIGGGPGVYAVELARRCPEGIVSLLDDAETLNVSRKHVEASGLAGRIRLVPGDAYESDLQGPYDLVFLSNVVHIFPADRNARLIRRCAAVLNPSGRLVLKDFFLSGHADSGRSGPLWNLLFAVNMLVGTEGGDCYTQREVDAWNTAAGLHFIQRIPVTERSSMLVYEKPGK